jgi:hypothetical protein
MIAYRISISLMGYPPAALGVENIRQYRAEMRKGIPVAIQAMPIFRLNPVFSGDVITLKSSH